MTAATPAIVTGASYRGLAVVRSLGRHGVPIHLVRTDAHDLALSSRFVTTSSTVASVDDLGRELHRLGARPELAGAVVIPTHDREAEAIAADHDALAARFRLTTQPVEMLERTHDKRRLATLATRIGVAIPATRWADSVDELLSVPITGPTVVKPAVRPVTTSFESTKAWLVHDDDELRAVLDQLATEVPVSTLMLQGYIDGDGGTQRSVVVLARQGRVIATLCAIRARQWPARFGRASTHVEITDNHHETVEAATAVVEAAEFDGIAELEFKVGADGTARLLDVNSRAWGWISACTSAGFDAPTMLYRQRLGEEVTPPSIRTGLRWSRASTDATTVREVWHSPRATAAWLASLRPPLSLAVFDRRDPMPALRSPLSTARRLVA